MRVGGEGLNSMAYQVAEKPPGVRPQSCRLFLDVGPEQRKKLIVWRRVKSFDTPAPAIQGGSFAAALQAFRATF